MVWPLSDELPCLLIERVELDEMVVCNPPLARRPMCMTLVIMGESFPKIEIHELTLCLAQHVHLLSETIGQVVRGFVGFSLERHQATVPSNTSPNKGQGAKPKWKRNLGRGRFSGIVPNWQNSPFGSLMLEADVWLGTRSFRDSSAPKSRPRTVKLGNGRLGRSHENVGPILFKT
jgi:hypothetical protein